MEDEPGSAGLSSHEEESENPADVVIRMESNENIRYQEPKSESSRRIDKRKIEKAKAAKIALIAKVRGKQTLGQKTPR